MALTPKQDAFALAYIETGNASGAYRAAYSADRMKPETINREAKALLDNPKIAARVADLRAEHSERHNITLDRIRDMLLADREFAYKCETPAAAITATVNLAKLYGHFKEAPQVNITTAPTLAQFYGGLSFGSAED